jgi:Putative MetA-pathway of phenol degradation
MTFVELKHAGSPWKWGLLSSRPAYIQVGTLLFAAPVLIALMLLSMSQTGAAQDLAPRAYLIAPVHSNAVTLTYAYYDGSLILDNALPITGATARVNIPTFTFTHFLGVAGRTASFSIGLPYGVGNFDGTVAGADAHAYRSGLLDSVYRFSINLKGGPAMDLKEFGKWRQGTIIGASVKVVAPTGQYDPTKLINYGGNRWAFRPELGLSKRWGRWILDTYGAVWFFTTNQEFFSHNAINPGVLTQKESPTGAFEGHLSYNFKPRLWASLDGNFWFGGTTSVNGIPNPTTQQRNSRVGGTLAMPVTKHQSLKVAYSNGAYIRYGGNYQNISLAWQYSWVGRH